MALWDVLSGKVYHWNTVKQEANKSVCRGLNAFIAERSNHREESHEYLITLRDELFTFFMFAEKFLEGSLEEDSEQDRRKWGMEPVKDRIMALNVRDHMCLLSVIHAETIMLLYAPKAEGAVEAVREHREFYSRHLGLSLDGICRIYSRPESFAEMWHRCRDWLKPDGQKDFEFATGHKAGDEMSAILGTSCADPGLFLFRYTWWSGCWEIIFTQLKEPHWRKAIEAELAAHA